MSMYIYANLPEPYGVFNQIRKDNYPFNRLFPKYLRTLVKLGRNKDMDIFSLLGYVENELAEEDRLPDLPMSEETLSFRFPIEDELIEDYYREQDLTNKMITQMIIRTTIRLAEVYGTSLSRLGALITNIDVGEEVEPRQRSQPKRKTSAAKVAITEPVREPPKKPVRKPAPTIEEDDEGDFDREDASRGDLLKKIDELTKKSLELVERSERRGIKDVVVENEPVVEEEDAEDLEDTEVEDSGEDKVVRTNPYLKDFL